MRLRSSSLDQRKTTIFTGEPGWATFADLAVRVKGSVSATGFCAKTEISRNKRTTPICSYFFSLSCSLSLTSRPPVYGIQLITRGQTANFHDLRWSGGLRVDVRDGAGEAPQSAFGGGMFDPLLLH